MDKFTQRDVKREIGYCFDAPIEGASFNVSTGELLFTVEGLAYRLPGAVIRRLLHGMPLGDLDIEQYCVDPSVEQARRGVL